MKARTIKNHNLAGFTLIEVMITVAVVAILAAVAMPQYFDYVTRSRLVEAKTNLVDMRTRLEQFFLDNRAYPGVVHRHRVGARRGRKDLPAGLRQVFHDDLRADCNDLHGHRHRHRQHGRLRLHGQRGQRTRDDGGENGLDRP